MSNPFRCPECGSHNHVLAALNESLLAISSDLDSQVVLKKIVDVARDLVHASYGAVGIADDSGGFSHFISSRERDGALTSVHEVLVGVLAEGKALSTTDIQQDPRFRGWRPGDGDLKSFLGVPIVNAGETVGAFYLANENTWGFTPEHRTLVELLAPHAGLAIKNVRLYEQSRELSITQERTRLARELHDSVTQTLFSMKLAAESATVLIETDPEAAQAQLATLQQLAREASSEMRSLVFELRPPELEIEGLVGTLRKHVDVLGRVHPVRIEFHHRGDRELEPAQEKEVFRIVQEALNNAIRHARANEILVELVTEDDKIRASVTDDGIGFDPDSARGARRLGLVSMRERAQVLSGDFSISAAPGRGTTVAVELRR